MELFQLSLLCICGVFLFLMVGKYDSSYSLLACLLLGLFLLEKTCGYVRNLLEGLAVFREKLAGTGDFSELLLKAIGCTFVTSFAANLCRDAGYGGLAVQMETVGNVYLLLLSLPVVIALLRILEGLC